ncbi:MAG TPA: twin-arginine translocation signal domain-containing protein, partial [Pseudoxanthomonas sp.]|nr:twin-arginine translocation signal domain-containing protein [Pseudoxanthomonas sp.]
MIDYKLTRREFIKSCGGAALVGAAGSALMFADDATAAANGYDTVVHLFLRGGIDGLNLVVPISGNDRTHYEQARPNLRIATSGAYAALPLTLAGGNATGFGLHPSASGLRDLWNDSKLAIVHACGMATTVTRSHFDAQ